VTLSVRGWVEHTTTGNEGYSGRYERLDKKMAGMGKSRPKG
jgi:hypothetical protein